MNKIFWNVVGVAGMVIALTGLIDPGSNILPALIGGLMIGAAARKLTENCKNNTGE